MLLRRSVPSSTAAENSTIRADLESCTLVSKNSHTPSHVNDHTRENIAQGRNITRAVIRRHSFALRKQSIVTVCCLLVLVSSLSVVCLRQLYAFVFEFQGPLDHFMAIALWKPYYGLYCPEFSVAGEIPKQVEKGISSIRDRKSGGYAVATTSSHVKSHGASWDCHSVLGTNASSQLFPQIFMIGARDREENTFRQWKRIIQQSLLNANNSVGNGGNYTAPRLHRINTLKISNQYALSGGALLTKKHRVQPNSTQLSSSLPVQNAFLCRSMKWEQRLFAVYQSVFAKLLSSFPNEQDFVVVEDDALLIQPVAFIEEVCHARLHGLKFYSLYRSPLQWQGRRSISCIYQHGTVAFYIQRSLMETIVQENRRGWFCRFPIDMYVSKLGPWYATRREIVGHIDGGRVGSTG